jgi:glutamyl-tRNA synthetase
VRAAKTRPGHEKFTERFRAVGATPALLSVTLVGRVGIQTSPVPLRPFDERHPRNNPMTVAVRFAPSPTGRLHVGNIRPAVLNYLFAKANGGSFMLRMDDTDKDRSTQEFADAIQADLTWLGFAWDRFARQSDRTERYAEVAAQLKAVGRLYACYESADDLDRKRKRQLARGMPPIYDRTGLKLTADEHAEMAAQGHKPHWRFKLENTDGPGSLTPAPTMVSWNDMIRGDQMVDVGSLSDPVLLREDGTALYTFTSVVDDVDFAITHIIRGEDHVTNSGVQIQLFEALGAVPPTFAHHSLLIGADGQALSKRLDSLSIQGFRDLGLEPMAVLSHAALIGTSDAIEPHLTLESLLGGFSLSKISTAPARFDVEDLKAFNARLLHKLPFDAVAERLAAMGIGGGEPFWNVARANISTLAETVQWWAVVSGQINPVVEDTAFAAKAAGLLPAEPWTDATWTEWTNAVKAATGAKGKALFHPLRLALTGLDSGPDMKSLLPLIGHARARARLTGATG